MKPTKAENILFAACVAPLVILILAITALYYNETKETLLVNLLKGTEMPYTTFVRLTEANQKTFIENGGKVSKE